MGKKSKKEKKEKKSKKCVFAPAPFGPCRPRTPPPRRAIVARVERRRPSLEHLL